ncbi:chaplin family protein, partial [Microbacterium sp. KSW4-4]|uniref:chaplin family protein n=1 Tax=Microbacterium sp. KSW4-4 TaxID=2851651 RepID=UPI001FFDC646
MRTYAKRVLWGTLIAGGITLLGATAANAAETSGDDGLLSGTQAVAPITAPITVVDNAISVLGDAASTTPAPAPAPAPAAAPAPAPQTNGAEGTASGTQAVVTVNLPVTVTDNAISLTEDSTTSTPAAAPPQSAAPQAPDAAGVLSLDTDGLDGVLSGTQALVAVNAPVTVSGNAISLLGDSESAAEGESAAAPAPAPATGSSTSGEDGTASGTQVVAPVTAPVSVGGNAISLL